MSDKPIIFSAPMVRALLDGRKTQTRRLLKQQPVARDVRPNGFFGVTNTFSFTLCDDGGANSTMAVPVGYQVGDRLWVKETFQTGIWRGQDSQVTYRATMEWPWDGPWRSPIFMPRKLSRLTLTVTDLRVQRLQDISEGDVYAEGAMERPTGPRLGSEVTARDNARNAFADLWESLHDPEAWDANPWVVALTFDVHRGNIDQITVAA